jgi:transketolase
MRNTIINIIHKAARENKDIYFLTGDLGYSVLEDFQSELPDQVINAGIAEQNMMSVAAGLALAGKKVFVYSIIPFVTMRCFEQIRVDLCYQNLDVTIIGVGGGFAYGTLGTTHYGLEDLAIMRSLPNMKVVAMSDPLEANQLFEQILNVKGPWYIRLNRGGEKAFAEQILPSKIGIGSVLKNGSQVTIFSIGAITDVAFSASVHLEKSGIQVEVIHMHTLKPLDKEIIIDRARTRVAIITLEEHSIIGGLGSAVAEVLADNGLVVPFRRLGLRDKYLSVIGKQDFLRKQAGLSEEDLVDIVKQLCK